jgi:hypothetical protein
MGYSVDASKMLSTPDVSVPAAQLSLQSDLGRQQLAQRDRLLGLASKMPLESWTPDIFGQDGMQAKAAQIAAINAFKSKQLEQQTNPAMAALRERVPQMMLEDVQGNAWQKQMDDWARTTGLTKMLATGLQDSTVGKSGLFDEATLQGQAYKQAQLQRARDYVSGSPAPQAGLDVGSILGAEQAAEAQNLQQREGFRNAMLGQVQGAQQGTTDWINKMLASTSSAAEGNRQEWQNYQQAMLKAAQNKADARNAMISAGIQAGAKLGSAAIGAM